MKIPRTILMNLKAIIVLIIFGLIQTSFAMKIFNVKGVIKLVFPENVLTVRILIFLLTARIAAISLVVLD